MARVFKLPYSWVGTAYIEADNEEDAKDKVFDIKDDDLYECSDMDECRCDYDEMTEVDYGWYYEKAHSKWQEKTKGIAWALLTLGWEYIAKSEDGVVWVFSNTPTKAPWKNDIKYTCEGRETMLCLVMDMHYDSNTDTYQDDRLWENLTQTPKSLKEIANG